MAVTKGDLQRASNDTAARHGFDGHPRLGDLEATRARTGALEDRVEQSLSERAATFKVSELRAALLEQSVGELAPREALAERYGR